MLHNSCYCETSHKILLNVSETHDRWKCNKKDCHVTKGLRKGAWLEGSKLLFDTIIFFTSSWSNEYMIAKFCAEELSDCSNNNRLEQLFNKGLC